MLGLEEDANDRTGKQRFLDVMSSVSKAYSLCCTMDEAATYHHEIAFLSAVRAAMSRTLRSTRSSSKSKRTRR